MCGRCGCTLTPETLRRACGYKSVSGKYRETQWMESEMKYVPCSNVGPRDVLACVVAGQHFGKKDDRVLCSMMWGIIPPWCEGDYRKHNVSTHNARLEGIQHSRLYSPVLKRCQRCIVIAEGIYEWKADKSKSAPKQPYYIYMAQDSGIKVDDPATWAEEWSEESGWKGLKLLKMAGIFDTFKAADGKHIHSCTIITRDASNVLSWLHHRSPVFLTTDKDVEVWLDKAVSSAEALDRLKGTELPKDILEWHPVSTAVNSVTNKNIDCRKEIQVKEEKTSRHTGFMASWLKRADSAKRKSTGEEKEGERLPKIPKTE